MYHGRLSSDQIKCVYPTRARAVWCPTLVMNRWRKPHLTYDNLTRLSPLKGRLLCLLIPPRGGNFNRNGRGTIGESPRESESLSVCECVASCLAGVLLTRYGVEFMAVQIAYLIKKKRLYNSWWYFNWEKREKSSHFQSSRSFEVKHFKMICQKIF